MIIGRRFNLAAQEKTRGKIYLVRVRKTA